MGNAFSASCHGDEDDTRYPLTDPVCLRSFWHDLSHTMSGKAHYSEGMGCGKSGKGGRPGRRCKGGSAVAGNLGDPRRVQTSCPRSVSSSNACAELVPAAPRLRPPPAAGPPTSRRRPALAERLAERRQRRCPRLPDVLDLQNNLRTLMMKCDMSDISFILEIQCADEVRLRFSASDWSLRRTCAVFKEFVLVGVTSSASFVRKRMLGSRTV